MAQVTVSPAICSFDGCVRQVWANGLCVTHNSSVSKGRGLRPFEGMGQPAPMCSFDGCDREARSMGLCAGHRSMQRRGKELKPLRTRRPYGAPLVRDDRGRKQCAKCFEWKPVHEFTAHSKMPDGRNVRCRRCNQKQQAVRLYGMGPDEFDARMDAQQGRCAVCGVDISDSPHIDHCHASGSVRGLLCKDCNIGLGMFKDDPRRLAAAIEYLKRNA